MNATLLIALQCLHGIGFKTILNVANKMPRAPKEFKDHVELEFLHGN